jgi:four helix bundle protein
MHNFRQLNIWKDARSLVKDVYLLTSNFPSDEKFGLKSQINRCAISVPSNIAEGSARGTNKDFAHFLRISLGSLFEMETQLLLAVDLGM